MPPAMPPKNPRASPSQIRPRVARCSSPSWTRFRTSPLVRSSRPDALERLDSFALHDRVKMVRRQTLQPLHFARRPPYLQQINLGRRPQAKVHPKIVLGEIAPSTPHLFGL